LLYGTLEIVYQGYHSKQDSQKKKSKFLSRQFYASLKVHQLEHFLDDSILDNLLLRLVSLSGREYVQIKHLCHWHLMSHANANDLSPSFTQTRGLRALIAEYEGTPLDSPPSRIFFWGL
jgi:hypothetical protein